MNNHNIVNYNRVSYFINITANDISRCVDMVTTDYGSYDFSSIFILEPTPNRYRIIMNPTSTTIDMSKQSVGILRVDHSQHILRYRLLPPHRNIIALYYPSLMSSVVIYNHDNIDQWFNPNVRSKYLSIIRDMACSGGNTRLLVITRNLPDMLTIDITNTDKIPTVLEGYIDPNDVVEFVVIITYR